MAVIARLQALRARYPLSPERYSQIAFAALVLLVVIVLTGAAVRLTGSGLGCPTWPKCTDTSVRPTADSYGIIEFSNRVLTSVVSAAAILAWLGAFFRVPARRDLMWLAILLPIGVAVQAVVGGVSVLAGLAPGWVMAHYTLSMIILVAAFALWWRSRPNLEPQQADRATVLLVRALTLLAAVAIVLGTASTAAGPHAGASGTGEFVGRLHWFGEDTLRVVIHVHGYVVTALGLGTIVAWWRSRAHGTRELQLTLLATLALLALQGIVGITQYELQLPTEIVWVHVALATLTWVGFVHAWAAAMPAERERSAAAAPRQAAPAGRGLESA